MMRFGRKPRSAWSYQRREETGRDPTPQFSCRFPRKLGLADTLVSASGPPGLRDNTFLLF